MTTDTLGNKQAIVKVRWLTQNSGLETWRDGGRVTPDTGHGVWWRPGGPTELQEEQEGAQQLRCTLSPAWLSSAQVQSGTQGQHPLLLPSLLPGGGADGYPSSLNVCILADGPLHPLPSKLLG